MIPQEEEEKGIAKDGKYDIIVVYNANHNLILCPKGKNRKKERFRCMSSAILTVSWSRSIISE